MSVVCLYESSEPMKAIESFELDPIALLTFLKQEGNGATLRELKGQFNQWSNWDKEIEQIIQLGWIKRKDGRYYFNLPVISSKQAFEQGLEIPRPYPLNHWESLLFDYFLSQSILAGEACWIWAEQPVVTYRVDLQYTQRSLWLDFGENQGINGLAHYFSTQQVSPSQQEILRLIGDVNPVFILNMSEQILKELDKSKGNVSHIPVLFIDLLTKIGYIDKNSILIKQEVCEELTDKVLDIRHEAYEYGQSLSKSSRQAVLFQLQSDWGQGSYSLPFQQLIRK